MDGIINIQPGQKVTVADREYEFVNLVENETDKNLPDDLQFKDTHTHKVVCYTRAEFDDLYSDGKIQWVKPAAVFAEMSPEDLQYDNKLCRVRQAFLQKFDDNRVSMTDKALEAAYAATLDSLRIPYERKRSKEKTLHKQERFWRTGSTLRRWIKERGESGNRPRACMRDRRVLGPQAMRINHMAMEVLVEAAVPHWKDLTLTPKDLYVAVRNMIAKKNAERNSNGLPPIAIPGRTTVWRYLTHHTNYETTRSRFGALTADKLYRPNKGSLVVKCILEKAIIDHTVADVHIVDDIHNLPCGRPWITVLIDVKSRLPLSFVIGFTPPSVETAAACVRRAVKPKKVLQEKYPDVRGKMPFGVPKTILCDNGWEFCGTSFKEACLFAGISVEWAPVRTPQYKGVCERLWRTFNQILIHKLEGAVPCSATKLREMGIDPSAKAVLLLSEFEELLYQAIVEVYARDFHEGINAVPEEVWLKRSNIDGIDYATNLAALEKSLAKRAPKRALDKNGIDLFGLNYSSPAVFDLLNDLRPRQRRQGVRSNSVKVEVNYHPEDISKIHVWNEVRRSWVTIPCTDQKYAAGLSEHHNKAILNYAKEVGLKFSSEDDRCAARVRLRQKIESFVGKRKIGDRRRAQRILVEAPIVTVSEEVEEPFDKAIVPIEAVSNRADGGAPVRNSSRSRKAPTGNGRKGHKPRNSKQQHSNAEKEQSVVVTANQHFTDPLAGLDRSQFIRKSSHEQ